MNDEDALRHPEPRSPAATSRRALIQAGMGLLGTGFAVAGIASAKAQAPAAQKLAQSAVQYQTHPNNGQLCSICVNFQAPNACAIVDGKISPIGWCAAFAPKG